MIELNGVTKRYGEALAVDNVSFQIPKGGVLGFLGRNGAGKTTTMNILTGYIAASAGTVTLDGVDILEDPLEVKRHIGYLPEQPPLYLDMTVTEYLRFVCNLKHVPTKSRARHIEDLCELARITDVRKRLIKNLSKGYRQRVGVAQALVGNPGYIIMDEPTVGLDPRQILEMRDLIRDLGKDHTVILSSHILSEVEATCDNIVIIHRGRIVAQDSKDNLTNSGSGTSHLTIRVMGNATTVRKAIRELPGVIYVQELGVKEEGAMDFDVETERDVDIRRQLFATLGRLNAPLYMLRPISVSLEDIFLELTKEAV